MKWVLMQFGRPESRDVQRLIDFYAKRLNHYVKFQHTILKDEDHFVKSIETHDYVLVCEEIGKGFTSTDFATHLQKIQNRGPKRICFLIGPAEGLTETMRARADEALSLSSLTFQHDLAALVLMEQLYRAQTIFSGEPYHK